MNINDPSIGGQPGQIWGGAQADEAVQTSQVKNLQEVQQLRTDTVKVSDKEIARAAPPSDPSSPGLPSPAADASSAPMSPAGGNPWSEASGFVAVLIALSEVAAQLSRNAFADSKTIAAGTAAEYEMGVEAGKMARDAKYAEAMADIVNGVGQLVAGGISLATAGAMAKSAASSRNAGSPYKDQVDACDIKMQNHAQQKADNIDAQKAKQKELQDEVDAAAAGSPEKTTAENKLKAQEKEVEVAEQSKEYAELASKEKLSSSEQKRKSELEDSLNQKDTEFASIKQERDKMQLQHEQYVVQEAANNRTLIQLVGEGLKSSAMGLGQMAGAPFKMLEGNYQMWQQIFQTASQVFDKFIGALTSDMQSQQQMIDSLNQLEQKLSDENTRAMMHNA